MTLAPETAHRAIGAIALAVGAGAALAPGRLLQVYGVPRGELNGAGTLGWRLFAMRNLVIGGGILAGNRDARRVAVAVQALDQLAFAAALRTRALPRPATVAAMATSGAIVVLSLHAQRADAPR